MSAIDAEGRETHSFSCPSKDLNQRPISPKPTSVTFNSMLKSLLPLPHYLLFGVSHFCSINFHSLLDRVHCCHFFITYCLNFSYLHILQFDSGHCCHFLLLLLGLEIFFCLFCLMFHLAQVIFVTSTTLIFCKSHYIIV